MNYEDLDNISEEDFPIQLDKNKISKDKSFLSTTRLLALELSDNPYLTIGTFIKSISDGDLVDILEAIEKDEFDDNSSNNIMGDILLITEMLAQAEGLFSESLDQLTERCNCMLTYFVLESLRRKGLVKVFHDNMSFGEEYMDKEIAARLDELP